jgi:hypothetical protein
MGRTIEQLAPPDWTGVRPVYKNFSDEFEVLTGPYGLEISQERKCMLAHLFLIIDEVDKCVDELPDKGQRDALTAAILDYLSDSQLAWDHPLATPLLAQKMSSLKSVVQSDAVAQRFLPAAKNVFDHTEQKRHMTRRKDLIEFIMLEGEATSELPLSILQIPPEHPFATFFSDLCRLMGIADLVVDARSDYRKQYILYKPNLGLYLTLNWILIVGGLKLMMRFPRPFHFLWFVIRFSWVMIREKDE